MHNVAFHTRAIYVCKDLHTSIPIHLPSLLHLITGTPFPTSPRTVTAGMALPCTFSYCIGIHVRVVAIPPLCCESALLEGPA